MKTKKQINPLDGVNGQLMVMAAHRYCLGRRSYIVGVGITWLTAWWETFESNTQSVIVRDTLEAIMDGSAGSEYEVKEWTSFAEWCWKVLSDESRHWVRTSLRHRDKPLPIFMEEKKVAAFRRRA